MLDLLHDLLEPLPGAEADRGEAGGVAKAAKRANPEGNQDVAAAKGWRRAANSPPLASRSPRQAVEMPRNSPESPLSPGIADLAEHFAERAAIVEHLAGLPRREAERHAATLTAGLARSRGYSWRALREALRRGGRPDLADGLPGEGVVDRWPWGLPQLAIHPRGERVVRQGVFRSHEEARR